MEIKTYAILYHEDVIQKDISRLDKRWREFIKAAISAKLTTQPDLFGVPLRQSLKGYRKLRVGGYRVVYRVERDTVKILIMGNRKDVYENAKKRSNY